MNEKLKTLLEKSKQVLKNVTTYSIIGVACVSSFFIGRYYDKLTREEPSTKFEVEMIKKEEVNLAIDQGNNLIIIDNKTGNYTIYQDSVGQTIFSLYAKNVWGQHNVNQTQNP
jgi:hypothetical protein